jgi:hypothetical protein
LKIAIEKELFWGLQHKQRFNEPRRLLLAWVDIAIPNQTTTTLAGARKARSKITLVTTTATIAVFFRIAKKIRMVTTMMAVVVDVLRVVIGGQAEIVAKTTIRIATIPIIRRNQKKKWTPRIENERDRPLGHGPVLEMTIQTAINPIYTTWRRARSIGLETIVVLKRLENEEISIQTAINPIYTTWQNASSIGLEAIVVLKRLENEGMSIQTAINPINTAWQNARSIGLEAIVVLERLENEAKAGRIMARMNVATFHQE